MMHTMIAGIDWWDIVGRTMLHYLWIGALVGFATMIIRRVAARLLPQVRYVVALVIFALLAMMPVAMASHLAASASEQFAASAPVYATNAAAARAAAVSPPMRELPSTAASSGLEAIDLALVVRWLPWAWIIGTPLTLLLVASGLYGAERMKRGAIFVIDGPIARAYAQAAESLRLPREVAIAVSDRVVTPLVIGIVRPMILLPASVASGWSPEQLEMILLHELAHVRRWDNLVNLVQRIIEALLFYQPAVWTVSNWVRLEREHCCDAAVLSQGKAPQQYAETLASLAMPGINPRYAAAALASHQLVKRIRHILKVEERTMKISRKTLITLVGSIGLSMGLVAVYAQQQSSEALKASDAQAKQHQFDGGHAAAELAKKEELFRRAEQRMAKASERAELVREVYRKGTVTLDVYLDLLLKEADSIQEFAKATDQLGWQAFGAKHKSHDSGFPTAANVVSEGSTRASDAAGNSFDRPAQPEQNADENALVHATSALTPADKPANSADELRRAEALHRERYYSLRDDVERLLSVRYRMLEKAPPNVAESFLTWWDEEFERLKSERDRALTKWREAHARVVETGRPIEVSARATDGNAGDGEGAERIRSMNPFSPAARTAASEPDAAERQKRLQQLRVEIAEMDRQLNTIQEEVELEQARVGKRQQLDNLRIALDQMRVAKKPAAVSGPQPQAVPAALPMAQSVPELEKLRFELDRERSAIAERDEIEKLKQELKALRSQRQAGEDYLPTAATPQTPKPVPNEGPTEK